MCVCVCVCVCVCGVCVCVLGHGEADGRVLVMTSWVLYSVMRVECSILVKVTLLQFP